jgi:glycosyltransferase involved in cell wall biosynthesis
MGAPSIINGTAKQVKILFVIGSTDIGGGNNVIFCHAACLQKNGFDVALLPVAPNRHKGDSLRWHPALRELRLLSRDGAARERFDLALATWWPTAYVLKNINSGQYAYFVQCIESWFVPDKDARMRRAVDATYVPLMPVITVASWMQRYLREIFGQSPLLVRNGMDKSLFSGQGPRFAERQQGKLRVLVEGPLGVDYKNVRRALKLVKKAEPDEIWLLTSSPAVSFPGADRIFSHLPIAEVGSVYRSCDVLVKLSHVEGMFGPPLEMFHCGGTAVAYDVNGHEEYMRDGVNSLVLPSGDEDGVVAAVRRLKREPELLASLKREASRTAAQWPDWDASSTAFLEAVLRIMEMPPISVNALKNILNAAEISARAQTSLLQNLKGRLKKHFPWLLEVKDALAAQRKNYGMRRKVCSLSPEEIQDMRRNAETREW